MYEYFVLYHKYCLLSLIPICLEFCKISNTLESTLWLCLVDMAWGTSYTGQLILLFYRTGTSKHPSVLLFFSSYFLNNVGNLSSQCPYSLTVLKICSKVPGSSQPLQHKEDMSTWNLWAVKGMVYHLVDTLKHCSVSFKLGETWQTYYFSSYSPVNPVLAPICLYILVF